MPTPDAVTDLAVTADDGSSIAVYDFGGEGPPLLLSHATGFHSHVFLRLAAELSGRFHAYAVDLRAHGRSRASASWDGGWEAFATDLLAVTDHLGLEAPYGFGHSCGGASLLLAEEARPGTFRQLYCYEPVVMPFSEPAPPAVENPLAAGALRRRELFASKADAEANYASKPPLDALTPEVLHDYVDYGFETLADGSVRLRCRGGDEARTYAHASLHPAYRDLELVGCPVTLAFGQHSDAFGEAILIELAARLERSRIEEHQGLGHFGPLEDPARIAASVIRAADTPPA
jgi:pimeloyl-ACP methyl ester carboxylesterase